MRPLLLGYAGFKKWPQAIPFFLWIVLADSLVLADEVVLVPGSSVKQAIGGRVRGQIQSESPAEVVVKLGSNTTSVPNDQIVTIRYDGQPATLQLAETRETTGQLAEAAELYKKAASEAMDKGKEAMAKAGEATKEAAKEASDKTKEAATQAADATKDAASKTADATKDAANKAVDAAKEAAQPKK